jgi:6-phosphogluconolactonase
MKHKMNFLFAALAILFACFVTSCEKLGDFIDHGHSRDMKGYVYTMSNKVDKNSILIFKQDANGTLTYKTAVRSGGAGTGMGLGSQGSLLLGKSHRWMYAVNAGDNTISSFKVSEDGNITLYQTINSGGIMPISLTSHQSLLYVVNMGGNICGFKIAPDGWLSKIEKSSQPLSSENAGPAEILFKPDGSSLVVTEKMTNKILIFSVNADGVALPAVQHPAEAETPFGFVFAGSKYLIVTDAFGGMPGKSVVTSLAVNGNNVNLKSNVPINQAAACWVVLTKNEDFAYVTNTGSNSITSLAVASNGELHLVDSIAAETGKTPTDICLSGNAAFVYNVNAMSGTIGEFRILPNGRLHSLSDAEGLPLSAVGLVAF